VNRTNENLGRLISEICNEAIESRWQEVAAALKKDYAGTIHNISSFRIDNIVSRAAHAALEAACRRHLETTFAADMDAIARDKVAKEIRKRRKQRGMDPEPISLKMEME
jgi:hypothetical protein